MKKRLFLCVVASLFAGGSLFLSPATAGATCANSTLAVQASPATQGTTWTFEGYLGQSTYGYGAVYITVMNPDPAAPPANLTIIATVPGFEIVVGRGDGPPIYGRAQTYAIPSEGPYGLRGKISVYLTSDRPVTATAEQWFVC